MKKLLTIFILCLIVGCNSDLRPKPKALLRLDYQRAEYDTLKQGCGYVFLKNKASRVIDKKGDCNLDLRYDKMKATIYITYKKVDGNLKNLLKDAQKLTYEHTIKASNIVEQPYQDNLNKVYGMFYQVDGNAASQSQFYVTDSVSNFVTGSIYFNVRPNYDSIQPAATYLREDIRVIMESIRWVKKGDKK